MQPSIFNVRVPLPDGEVFLMNTLTDAQLRVTADVVALLDAIGDRRLDASALDASGRDAVHTLAEHGFLVGSRQAERDALDRRFEAFRDDTSQLRVTVLTTLQCNFACGYCVQGDHGEANAAGRRMSLDTAARVASWIEEQVTRLHPRTLVLTFFGGEPLLNLPVVYFLAERLWTSAQVRGVTMLVNVITNGLLLTPDVVDRLVPFGLNGVKVTLDGDREAHDASRPLRGGQGTFDRIIANLSKVAGRCAITIGGNVDARWIDRYPALLEFLRAQDFAPSIAKVSFKPVIQAWSGVSGLGRSDAGAAATQRRTIPLTPIDPGGATLGGACQSAAGLGGGGREAAGGGAANPTTPCDTCHFVDDQLATLRETTKRHGFPTPDGVHMGPCEIHRRHAHTIGPDGELYACPGFSGDTAQAVGTVMGNGNGHFAGAARRFDRIEPWRQCGDCAFIPVCAGGCSVAAHHELGDMSAPACHKRSFEAALVSLAHEAVSPGGPNR